MYTTKIKRMGQLLILLVIIGLAVQPMSVARALDNNNGPELPFECSSIQVPPGNQLSFHTFARGVQIYRWSGATWDFVAPRATLFAEPNFFGEVGSHYAGPKWESKSGSIVQARRVLQTGCAPDPNAIEWLLLEQVPIEDSGSGIFSKVTYIQRTNTSGGMRPTEPGSVPGEVKEVPYTAQYYFYRAENPASNAAL